MQISVHPLHKLPYGELPAEVEEGVMFCTYQSLIAKNKLSESRLEQLVAWAARATDDDPESFDGCLVFDEAHRAKNLTPPKGDAVAAVRGSKTAEAVLMIQKLLPHARVLYVSATAAAETKDLGYMVRLGLWGKGCPFPDFYHFAQGIQRAGVGAMEVSISRRRAGRAGPHLTLAPCAFACVSPSGMRWSGGSWWPWT